jgi:Peptidase S24-like
MDAPYGAPPDAVEFSLHDRFRATFVRYSQVFGDFEQAAIALKRSWKSFLRYLRGANIPGPVLHQLATFSGVSLEWLVSGKGAPRADFDIVQIGTADIRASAGGGSHVHYSPDYTVPFPRLLVSGVLALRPEFARLLYASGDSMSPTIDDGDWLLVSVAEYERLEPKQGSIYVLSVGENIYVKRLFRSERGWLMQSDSETEDPRVQLIGEDFNVVGRVVWVGHRL